AGWYDGENKWYFLSDTISKDTTLSAKWKLNDYKMTFDSIGGNPVATQTVPFNTAAKEPLVPTKE
ncbi:InlB B-repeat-containing protein, partial [Kurthia sibirica]